MSKYLVLLLFASVSTTLFGQSNSQEDKFRQLSAKVKMRIWDKNNSDKTMNIEVVKYDDIPKYLDFRGTIVECLKWTDGLGDNLLIQSLTGYFIGNEEEDKWEIYAYLFRKEKEKTIYKPVWRIYDYNECFGVDWYAGFIPAATTITDVNHNGIAEISMPYVLICRGGMDPGTMKIIMYEGDTKYAIRGKTMIYCGGEYPYGGNYELSDNLEKETKLKNFILKQWNTHKCEDERFY